MSTIYWSISDKRSPDCLRSGTVLPHKGESWPHMVRFLKSTGSNEFLTAYQYTPNGIQTSYHDIDFETEDSKIAETWFSDK